MQFECKLAFKKKITVTLPLQSSPVNAVWFTGRWPIEEQALKINATLRVCQLARPRSRTMIRDDGWDPYMVSKAARYAQISPRVEELSAPIPRKCRSKRVAAA